MITINQHFLKLESSYLFSDIAARVNAFSDANPDRSVIKLGIGDVTEPLPRACIEALHSAVDEMAKTDGIRGYGPEQGYPFLREAIARFDYQAHGIEITPDEVFVSDGAKCDTGNFQELFTAKVKVAVPDPVYPVYVDTNVMAGRSGDPKQGRYAGLVYLECHAGNGYVPTIPQQSVDLVYLCSPNNPTGATASKEELAAWVEYAKANKALILFDAAYEAFIRDETLPHSIYEIEGAKEVAVEFRSFSKSAGFTGTRCAFTVVPEQCRAFDSKGNLHKLHALWNRRQATKFNGVAYPVQRAAEAVYSPEGVAQTRALTDAYMQNAVIVRERMTSIGYELAGGENSPYIWIKTNTDSWSFFDRLLNEAAVVVTPGSGFGSCGEGYIRISAFNSRSNVEEAMERVSEVLG
jgi:LL-diaminopimelate aminotransferase